MLQLLLLLYLCLSILVQLDWTLGKPRKKIIFQQTEIVTDIPKPPLQSSRKGASSLGGSFLYHHFLLSCVVQHL